MNQASQWDLALAVARAGAFPSLYLPVTAGSSTELFHTARSQFESFVKVLGSRDVMVATDRAGLMDKNFVSMLADIKATHIEILPSISGDATLSPHAVMEHDMTRAALRYLRRFARVLLRIYEPMHAAHAGEVDAVCVKGQESGGRTGSWTVQNLFLHQKQLTPDLPVIPYGGISTAQQVRWYLDNGAAAVGIGTLFAMSQESPLASEVKQRLLSSGDQVRTTPDSGQNCVIFDAQLQDNSRDWNRNQQLAMGISGDGSQGLIYAGQGLSQIHTIRSVRDIVADLMSHQSEPT
jgi:NAD(P)H-dependent flavin oxidoreductase YrpB (nitropropane dioxygenase family)